MTKLIRFTKMHGASNDYIYVDTTRYPIPNPGKMALEWSKYHTGIGSDGLILIGSSSKADFSMRMFNADGSEGMMCGNGIRCVGKYVYDNKLTDKKRVSIDTLSGIKTVDLHTENDKVVSVTVDMGSPLERGFVDWKNEYPFKSAQVSMGNPHLVTFVQDVNSVELGKIGPELECHPMFPNKTNVEFAQVLGEGTIRMRVWERGSGITQACGTGACATAVAAFMEGLSGRRSNVIMDGGRVTVEWDEATGHVFMTGGATHVFNGEIEIEE